VIALDTSALVAAFATWHEHHAAARALLDEDVRLVSHCAFESYSVLTRMPPPHRAPPDIVQGFLDRQFPKPWLALPPKASAALLATLPAAGIVGGATYDAIVAATAHHARATLVTCDVRAARTYDAIGVTHRPLK
jgi:predicted nucleic acid-binding protein